MLVAKTPFQIYNLHGFSTRKVKGFVGFTVDFKTTYIAIAWEEGVGCDKAIGFLTTRGGITAQHDNALLFYGFEHGADVASCHFINTRWNEDAFAGGTLQLLAQ